MKLKSNNQSKKILFSAALFFILALNFTIVSCSSQKIEISEKDFDPDVVQLVNQMTLREKIGQLILLNFRYQKAAKSTTGSTEFMYHDGTKIYVTPLKEINPTVISAIQNYHIGSVILFGENFLNTDNALIFISKLKEASYKNGDPQLLIGVDQEGGRVNRIKQYAVFPPAMTIGNSGDLKNAYLEGQYIAEQLNAFGINLDFAPVCDVNSNPKNPVIGDRSFSSKPDKAAEFSNSFQKGMSSKKVIPCAKHFPGHGDTDLDSHYDLPQIKKTKTQWLECEALPFKTNISSGIPMIMSAHIQYPALDSSRITALRTGKSILRPATLSKKILTNILRGELGFKGVICTDDLSMRAISSNFTESQTAIEALNAGADLLCDPVFVLCADDVKRLESLYTDIENAVKTGKLPLSRINESAMRIIQLKKNYDILNEPFVPMTKAQIENAKQQLSSPKHKAFTSQF